ncbi:hypothetical protein COO09_01435 [Rhizorhabdus dicambivorans]|uniref:Uncharacterized protein n=1 Tax=Rhizorhabdus dicambivorans TaxID=1850238 RepID=A0A2A4G2R1_9SPHN|nr:hypothetical protein CMV14_12050 [Rhizorhabdus dicambivorans]PCE44322.1 hypothetical protein COO09_01435 [Rhizorhabdus dicambivorans]
MERPNVSTARPYSVKFCFFIKQMMLRRTCQMDQDRDDRLCGAILQGSSCMRRSAVRRSGGNVGAHMFRATVEARAKIAGVKAAW